MMIAEEENRYWKKYEQRKVRLFVKGRETIGLVTIEYKKVRQNRNDEREWSRVGVDEDDEKNSTKKVRKTKKKNRKEN